MSALELLNAYLRKIEARLRLLAWTRGAAMTAGAALGVTLVLALEASWSGYTPGKLTAHRTVLYLALALAVAFGLVVPLLKLNRRRAARDAERRFPDFEERLLTLAERPEAGGAFDQLLAEDALELARRHEAEALAPAKWIAAFTAAAGAAVTVLIWLIFAGPGFLGYGSALLWGNTPRAGTHPLRDILVEPGNATVRRHSDERIRAELLGFSAGEVHLLARYRGTTRWNDIRMQPAAGTDGYEFVLAGLEDTLDYHVEAAGLKSKAFVLKVRDLPAVSALKVTYHYPKALGLADVVENPGGDLRAVEGTVAEVDVKTTGPLAQGLLVLDDGTRIPLAGGAEGWLQASVPIKKDGAYYVAALDEGELVRLSEDYFIEAKKDAAPVVKIEFPGRDTGVSPIEEVTVKVEGSDDYGLHELALHYSVNGGPEKTVSLLKQQNEKQVNGSAVIALEDFHLSPGDLVSYYASARDASHSEKTDMFFAHAEPYDLRYSQAQQGGGMSGGEQDQNNISEHEKEIIAATWNANRHAPDAATAASEAKFLDDMQAKLGAQARSLADRMRSRHLDSSSAQFKTFTENMDQAAAGAQIAAATLGAGAWAKAMPVEQQILQHLLRAEAVFRDIQVAFGASGSGNGMQGGMGRDLERLLDLELDTEKNQYETGAQASAKSEAERKADEALEKLKELARRQQELAAQQKTPQQQLEQRWQQEMLRRQAEQLRQQLEELRRQSAGRQQGQQGPQQGQGSPQQAGMRGQQNFGGVAGASPRQLEQALDDVEQAEEAMRQGASGRPDAARQAAQRLNAAGQTLEQAQKQRAQAQMSDLANQAKQLAEAHREFSRQLLEAFGKGQQRQDPRLGPSPGSSSAGTRRLAEQEQRMADQMEQLQRKLESAAQSMAAGQPEAAQKLRQALGDAEQNELAQRMRMNADWIRRGEGQYTWMRESMTGMGLDKLNDQIQEAQKALKAEPDNGGQQIAAGGKDGGAQQTEQALNQVESLRRQLERMRRRMEGQSGQGGAQGQQEGQRMAPPLERGTGSPRGGSPVPRPSQAEQDGILQGFSQLRRMARGQPGVEQQLDQVWGALGRLNWQGEPGELAARLSGAVLPGLEQVEAELRRKLDEQTGGEIRTSGPDAAPQGYANAAADYFRRLSRGQK
jgi:hypothetical protein